MHSYPYRQDFDWLGLLCVVCSADPACGAVAPRRSGALGRQGWVAHSNESDFGGVFFGVIDELPIVPVASRNIVPLDGDCRGPSSASSWKLVSDCFDSAMNAGILLIETKFGGTYHVYQTRC